MKVNIVVAYHKQILIKLLLWSKKILKILKDLLNAGFVKKKLSK